MRVAAVVVTYNRKELLAQTLFALIRQSYPVDRIHVVDNASSDGTLAFLGEQGLVGRSVPDGEGVCKTLFKQGDRSAEIVYRRLSENIGGAGGFARGMASALTGAADWIWMMDDDARPEPDALLRLSACFPLSGVSALCGSVVGVDGKIQETHRGIRRRGGLFPLHRPLDGDAYDRELVEVDLASFVGVLVRARTAKKIGLPEERFFIHYDDVEFSLRMRKEGRILLVPGSRIIHDDALSRGGNARKLLGKTFRRISDGRIWLSYFGPRNIVFLARETGSGGPFFFLALALFSIRQVCGILLFDRHKRIRIACFLNAVRDGLRGDFGRSYPFLLRNRGLR